MTVPAQPAADRVTGTGSGVTGTDPRVTGTDPRVTGTGSGVTGTDPRTIRPPRLVLAAGAVVIHRGCLLLVQRSHPPQTGRWTLPGGRCEPGESPAEAAARETLEETGVFIEVGVQLGRVLIPHGHDPDPARAGVVYDIMDFAATYRSGEPAPADDAADARWVPLAELTSMPLTFGLMDHLRRFGIPVPGV